MDESWRMSIGDGFVHNSSSRRRSMEKDRRMNPGAADEDDFRDVFGGPPRVLLLPHSRSAAGSFYDEVISPPASAAAGTGRRRNLTGFCVPSPNNNTSTSTSISTSTSTSTSNRRLLGSSVRTEDGFYDDIFGSSDFLYTSTAALARDRSSRSSSTTKSKSANNYKSSSKSYDHDGTLSSFASKLQPITIPTRQHGSSQPPSASALSGGGGGSSNRTLPINNIHFSSFVDFADYKAAGSTAGFSRQYLQHRPAVHFSYSLSPSAETNSYCTNCCRKPSGRRMYQFSDVGSPSSAFLEPMSTTQVELRELEKKVVVEVKRERERSSANPHPVRETEGAAALDEAIAWAREKFWNQQASIRSEEILDQYSEESAKGGKEKHFA